MDGEPVTLEWCRRFWRRSGSGWRRTAGRSAAADAAAATAGSRCFRREEFPEFLTLPAYQTAGVSEREGLTERELRHSSYDWGGWGRTSNLPVNSRALCQLSYTPKWSWQRGCDSTWVGPIRSSHFRPGV